MTDEVANPYDMSLWCLTGSFSFVILTGVAVKWGDNSLTPPLKVKGSTCSFLKVQMVRTGLKLVNYGTGPSWWT